MSKKLDQSGAVSLLSVVIFATIITVLITAYMRSAVSQQAESLAYDFSNRAYYAAESGVQDTLRVLKAYPAKQTNKTNCQPFVEGQGADFGYPGFGASYTCQLVAVDPKSLEGDVIPNSKSAMIQLKPSVALSNPKIVLRWSQRFTPSATRPALVPRGSSSPLFTPNDVWNAGQDPNKPVHALLRVNLIAHPANSFARSDIKQRVVLLNPTSSSVSGAGNSTVKMADSTAEQQQEFISNAKCYSSSTTTPDPGFGNYSCQETITLDAGIFSGQDVYLRLGSVYRSTKFSVQLLDGTATVDLTSSQADIDITGKAGDNTYRRLKQKVSLGGFDFQYGPDAALVAGEGICKNFVLGTSVSTYQQGCDPLN